MWPDGEKRELVLWATDIGSGRSHEIWSSNIVLKNMNGPKTAPWRTPVSSSAGVETLQVTYPEDMIRTRSPDAAIDAVSGDSLYQWLLNGQKMIGTDDTHQFRIHLLPNVDRLTQNPLS